MKLNTLSSSTYKLMEDLAGMRFKIINQMVKTFIQQEKKFFETCYFLINNFYKGMGIMEQGLPYQKSSYDPMKYIRANKIMEGVDVNSLPNIKMKDKYSSNNFKNSSNMPINNCNENYNKKYSFEDYKLRKSNMQNNSNINNNQNNINNINTINNNNNNQNNDLKPLNPFSYEAYKKRTQSLDTLKRQHLNNNTNNNANYYQSNLNLVMNSIIGKENISQINPFNNLNNNESNPYAIKESNNINSYNDFNNNLNKNNNKNNDDSDEIPNPYSSIFNNQNNNNQFNNKNNINPIFNNNQNNNQQNNNNNNNFRKPQDKYNFGF